MPYFLINAEQNKDNIAVTHSCYDAVQKQRVIWQDVIAGTLKLRAKCKEYLPQFPAETQASYDLRVKTSTLFNMTFKTRAVMVGLAFQDSIQFGEDVAPEIQELAENIDNQGTHFDVFARELFEDSFEGYAGILIDAPAVQASNLEQQQSMGLRPYCVKYTADQITNWRYRINAASKARELSLIVLRECSMEPDGEYTNKEVVRYRKFWIDNDNTIQWAVYREVKKDKEPTTYELEGGGIVEGLSAVPFVPVRDLGEPPPFLDIANKNIEHYQSYSDYKSLIHKTNVPMFWRKEYTGDATTPFTISGDAVTDVGEKGGVGWAEVTGHSLEGCRVSLVDMCEDMARMGLSVLADKTAKVEVTATEFLLDNIAETAELRVMTRELQDSLEAALGFMAEYLGMDKDAGGSLVMGTAWANQQKTVDINKTLDTVNKGEQYFTDEEIQQMLHPDFDEQQIKQQLEALAAQKPVRDAQMFGGAG